jgi:DNA mismatch endonuclease (patch repair protein)
MTPISIGPGSALNQNCSNDGLNGRIMRSSVPKLLSRNKRAPLNRSQMMSRIRSRDTLPERTASAAVHALGIRFRKHASDLPGKPDLVNRTKRWAIFVHGCFWHSHEACKLASNPKSNRGYWVEKLRRNKERDAKRIALLRQMGFRVLVVWECDVRDGRRLHRILGRFFRS